MDRITIDFERALRKANELDDHADRLRRMTQGEYETVLQSLSNDWSSDSATAFFSKGDRLRRDMEETARNIETVASNLRRAARRIYEAERRAEEIARQRTGTT